jgi:hypothetical protein
LIGKSWLYARAKPAQYSNCFVGGQQADGESGPGTLRHSPHRSITTTYV